MIVAHLFVLWQVWRRFGLSKSRSLDAGQAALQFHRQELERQHGAVSNAWLWYILLFMPAFLWESGSGSTASTRARRAAPLAVEAVRTGRVVGDIVLGLRMVAVLGATRRAWNWSYNDSAPCAPSRRRTGLPHNFAIRRRASFTSRMSPGNAEASQDVDGAREFRARLPAGAVARCPCAAQYAAWPAQRSWRRSSANRHSRPRTIHWRPRSFAAPATPGRDSSRCRRAAASCRGRSCAPIRPPGAARFPRPRPGRAPVSRYRCLARLRRETSDWIGGVRIRERFTKGPFAFGPATLQLLAETDRVPGRFEAVVLG